MRKAVTHKCSDYLQIYSTQLGVSIELLITCFSNCSFTNAIYPTHDHHIKLRKCVKIQKTSFFPPRNLFWWQKWCDIIYKFWWVSKCSWILYTHQPIFAKSPHYSHQWNCRPSSKILAHSTRRRPWTAITATAHCFCVWRTDRARSLVHLVRGGRVERVCLCRTRCLLAALTFTIELVGVAAAEADDAVCCVFFVCLPRTEEDSWERTSHTAKQCT